MRLDMDKIKIIKSSCGCKFNSHDGKHAEIDFYNMNLYCPKTWGLIGSGATKGIFQLESHLGREWAKKFSWESIVKEIEYEYKLIIG